MDPREQPKIVSIGKSDADLAAEHKERIGKLLEPILRAFDDAKRDGFLVQFQISQPDAFGRYSLTAFDILKKF